MFNLPVTFAGGVTFIHLRSTIIYAVILTLVLAAAWFARHRGPFAILKQSVTSALVGAGGLALWFSVSAWWCWWEWSWWCGLGLAWCIVCN